MKSAEAGGPRRFDPWVRGVWLVDRLQFRCPPGGRGGGDEGGGGWGEGVGERGAPPGLGRHAPPLAAIEPSRLRGAPSLDYRCRGGLALAIKLMYSDYCCLWGPRLSPWPLHLQNACRYTGLIRPSISRGIALFVGQPAMLTGCPPAFC